MRARSAAAATVAALMVLGGCTHDPRPRESTTAVASPRSAPEGTSIEVPGPTADGVPARAETERWYPVGSQPLTPPPEDRTGSATFDVTVPGTEYTVHLVCRGGGKIRLWDSPVGADPAEPVTHPCDGVPVDAVTVLDGPERRALEVQATEPTARWSLVAFAGLPDSVKVWR